MNYIGFPGLEGTINHEKTNAALMQWLFTYGYGWAYHDEMLDTDLDRGIWWDEAVKQGVLEINDNYEQPTSYRLTPKVHEYLAQYKEASNDDL